MGGILVAVPSEFKYSKEHEWVKVEDNVATMVSQNMLKMN